MKRLIVLTVMAALVVSNTFAGFADVADVQPQFEASSGKGHYLKGTDGTKVDTQLTLSGFEGTLSGARVMIENVQSGDELFVGVMPELEGKMRVKLPVEPSLSVSYDSEAGVLKIDGEASINAYQEILRNVQFTTNSDVKEDRNIIFMLGEGLYYPANKLFYEFVEDSLNWDQAKSAASRRSLFGRQGYLVTLTSAGENAFVAEKCTAVGWIGARDVNYQPDNMDYMEGGYLENGDWRWVTGPEGLLDGCKGLKFYKGYSVGGKAIENQHVN